MNIYDKMKKSKQIDVKGNYYLDPFTCNFENFKIAYPVINYNLTQQDIDRFDFFTYNIYGAYYDDILLWYNQKDKHNLQAGDLFYIVAKADIENFYRRT